MVYFFKFQGLWGVPAPQTPAAIILASLAVLNHTPPPKKKLVTTLHSTLQALLFFCKELILPRLWRL